MLINITAEKYLNTFIGRDLSPFTGEPFTGRLFFWNVMDKFVKVERAGSQVSIKNKVDNTLFFFEPTEYERLENVSLILEKGFVKEAFFTRDCAC